MALTTARTGLTPQQWDDQFFTAYVRENRFKRYMGTDENSIIQLKEDLTKENGDAVTFALVNELTAAGVTGNATLEGNEESLDSRSFKVTVAPLRHAVAVTEWDEQKSAIDLRNAAKMMLKMWNMTKMRDGLITALGSINGLAYGSASESQKDAWLVDNADRVLFGATRSNASSNDHSTSLANVDSTSDKLTTGAVSLMKRIAQTATPKIRPIRLREDEEWYVMFANSRSFRDLTQDSAMQQANRDARPRNVDDNPLFVGGSLVWDGVIIREIPEIGVLTGVGASSIDVGPAYLCGAQALAVAWAQRTRTTTQVSDYGFRHGVGCSEIRAIEKMLFGSGTGDTDDLKQHGVVTGFFSAVADA
jgi:N4-gp56 family major capsid protein